MFLICVIVSHKQETITSLIESLNNGPEHYVSTYEVSFIVATAGNIMVDLGWREQLAITSGINNRAVELVFVCEKSSSQKHSRILISNPSSLHESSHAK